MDRWFDDQLGKQHHLVLSELFTGSGAQLIRYAPSVVSTLHLLHYWYKVRSGKSSGTVVKDPSLLICAHELKALATTVICVKPIESQIRSFLSRGFRLSNEDFERLHHLVFKTRPLTRNEDSDIAILLLLQKTVESNFDYIAEASDDNIRLIEQGGRKGEKSLRLDSTPDLFSSGVRNKMKRKSGVTDETRHDFSEARVVRIMDFINAFQQA